MRIISRQRLRAFWESRKADSQNAERDLSAWYKLAKKAEWSHFATLKQTFPAADQVGNCVVFDVGNNRFRFISRVNYRQGIIYILKVMDHEEYDNTAWADDCGCHEPPPKRQTRTKKTVPKTKPLHRGRQRRK